MLIYTSMYIYIMTRLFVENKSEWPINRFYYLWLTSRSWLPFSRRQQYFISYVMGLVLLWLYSDIQSFYANLLLSYLLSLLCEFKRWLLVFNKFCSTHYHILVENISCVCQITLQVVSSFLHHFRFYQKNFSLWFVYSSHVLPLS